MIHTNFALRRPVTTVMIFAAVATIGALAAKLLGAKSPKLTIGHDAGTAGALAQMGAVHCPCDVKDCVVDARLKVVTTPAYMEARTIKDVHAGIDKLVAELAKLMG